MSESIEFVPGEIMVGILEDFRQKQIDLYERHGLPIENYVNLSYTELVQDMIFKYKADEKIREGI